MTKKISPGTCLLCRAPVTERKALKHGMGCLEKSGWPAGEKPSLLIMIRERQDKDYWLAVLARHDTRLGDLDRLIRDVWVECCDHLSSFKIGGVDYEPGTDPSSDLPLYDLIAPGSTFTYVYDFGSPTSLSLKVIGETPITPPDGPLCLIARNDPPSIPCILCGADADFMLDDRTEDFPRYYCHECLVIIDYDPEDLEIISNSPRNGVCGYIDDHEAAILWYPPGWTADELAPESPDEFLDNLLFGDDADLDNLLFDGDEDVDAAMAAAVRDIGADIDAFVEAEREAYGEEGACMAGDTVMSFCTFMHLLYGADIDEWDAPSVQECLVDHISQNPIYLEDWPEKAVPILCRFLERMEAAGRIKDASTLCAALKEGETAFQIATTSPEKNQALFKHLLMEAGESGIDMNDIDEFLDFAVKRLVEIAGFDLDDEEVQKGVTELLEGGALKENIDGLRAAMIFDRCENFCDRFEDETILEHCREIIIDLSDHPAAPLSRGDGALWSAAIVYAACQDENLIRAGRGSTSLGDEISSFFGFERASIRNKTRALRGFLSD